MKKWFFILAAVAAVNASCSKDSGKNCTATAPATVASAGEIAYIQSYLSGMGITATQQANGVFYVLNPQGSGKSPNLCSDVTCRYRGTVLGNTAAFDSTTGNSTATFSLTGLIDGWKAALPLVKTGGTVTLYIPPSLGYGSQVIRNNVGAVIIPANSYLEFNISLTNVD